MEKCLVDGREMWRKLALGPDQCVTKNSADKLTLTFNPSILPRFNSLTGSTIKVPITDSTYDVEYFSASLPLLPREPQAEQNDDYFHTFVEHFVAKGYERGRTIRSVPYDWRMSPVQLEHRSYFDDLKGMIQTIASERARAGRYPRVTLVAHSTGSPLVLYFLNSLVTQAWKDKYIHAFISLAGAWTGGSGIVQTIVSGETLTSLSPLVDNNCKPSRRSQCLVHRTAARTFPGVLYLLPKPSEGADRDAIITTPKRTYTASDYDDLFKDIGFSDILLGLARELRDINAGFPAPKVRTHCLFGTLVPTPESFVYDKVEDFPDSPPTKVVTALGDGTISNKVSHVCLKWMHDQPELHKANMYPHVSHLSILKDKKVLAYIDDVVFKFDDRERPPAARP